MSGLQKVVIITELKILTPVSEEFCLLSAKLKILQVLFSVLHIDTNQQKPCRSQLKEILPYRRKISLDYSLINLKFLFDAAKYKCHTRGNLSLI